MSGDQFESQSLRVVESKSIVVAGCGDGVVAEALFPELQRGNRGYSQGDPVDHPCAGAPAQGARVLEEGEVGPGRAIFIGVEQVVDVRVVLVHRLGDQAQAEDAGVEGQVARSVAGDAGDVVDAVEAHRGKLAIGAGG